ncbi:MAG: penicillin acylase family protein, partial [Streptosporangiaceae bacterium]
MRLAGLRAPVTIIRDARGIPHITAANVHDLYLAEGYAMAQDRLWQMDVLRRVGEGRLAEIFGPVALEADRGNRTVGLDRAAAAEAGRLAPEEAALLGAFADGVNAYISGRGWKLPLEFWVLRYRPQAWRPEDSLAVAAYMYQVLSSNYKDKLRRESFTAALGPELTAQLYPERSPWEVIPGEAPPPSRPRPPFPGLRGRSGLSTPPVFGVPSGLLADPPAGGGERWGSNSWALAGSRSFDGRPILANDPHLQFEIPGQWWVVQVSAPGLDAAGAALAGFPGVIVGHNQNIAWGVTNADADVQDLYRETVDGKGNALTPSGWKPTAHWNESIPVRGQAATELDLTVTRHGPIVARDGGGPLALDWSLYAPGALQAAHVLLQIGEAQNWQQFEAALAGFAGPAQNFIYADTAGHIGYQAAGWVPLRASSWGAKDASDGSVPVPGAVATYDWHGW